MENVEIPISELKEERQKIETVQVNNIDEGLIKGKGGGGGSGKGNGGEESGKTI